MIGDGHVRGTSTPVSHCQMAQRGALDQPHRGEIIFARKPISDFAIQNIAPGSPPVRNSSRRILFAYYSFRRDVALDSLGSDGAKRCASSIRTLPVTLTTPRAIAISRKGFAGTEAVLRELSEMLVRDLCDPRLRGITLTRLRWTTICAMPSPASGARAASSAAKSASRSAFATRPSWMFSSIPAPSAPPVSTRYSRVCAQGLNKISLPSPIFAS